jgi:hypothetical protein
VGFANGADGFRTVQQCPDRTEEVVVEFAPKHFTLFFPVVLIGRFRHPVRDVTDGWAIRAVKMLNVMPVITGMREYLWPQTRLLTWSVNQIGFKNCHTIAILVFELEGTGFS